MRTIELETKVNDLQALIQAVRLENSVAKSQIHNMEGELLYYRGLFQGVTHQKNSLTTSYSMGEERPDESEFSTSMEMVSYNGVTTTSHPSSIRTMLASKPVNEDERAGSCNSSHMGSCLPAVNLPVEYLRSGNNYRPLLPRRVNGSLVWRYE